MTAIDYLVKQLDIITRDTNKYDDFKSIFEYEIEQAKEMEKEQMKDFYRKGYLDGNSNYTTCENGKLIMSSLRLGELYYDKKFKTI